MLKSTDIVNPPSTFVIKLNLFRRYITVGRFLHGMTLVTLIIFVISIQNVHAFDAKFDFTEMIWMFLSLFGCTVSVISQLDAYGRFQNYKQLKDKFYMYGFNLKLSRPFMYSKCQRDAILVAANDFEFKNEVEFYFYEKGYRWYHVLPDVCIKQPLVIFKIDFWNKILFTKYYQFQNYYW